MNTIASSVHIHQLFLITTGLALVNPANAAAIIANASSNGNAAATRTTFYTTTVGESPDNTENFDGFADGTVITTQISGVTLSGKTATIETGDISGSTPAGGAGGALEVSESGTDTLIFTFDTPVLIFTGLSPLL